MKITITNNSLLSYSQSFFSLIESVADTYIAVTVCYTSVEVCLPDNSNSVARSEVLILVPMKSTVFLDQKQCTEEIYGSSFKTLLNIYQTTHYHVL